MNHYLGSSDAPALNNKQVPGMRRQINDDDQYDGNLQIRTESPEDEVVNKNQNSCLDEKVISENT